MKKAFTAAMMAKIREAQDDVRGTAKYYDYILAVDVKSGNRWLHAAYGTPDKEGVIKSVRGKLYIMCEDTRYELNETVWHLIKEEA